MSEPTPDFLDTSKPNTARIFDYILGGTANFEVDRIAAKQMIELIPSVGKFTRMRRAFVQEAAQILFEEGFRQFLDISSGMPTQDHIHIVVPEARVVYSDINPVAVSYGENLLADLKHVHYIHGDARNIEEIVQSTAVKELIDLNEKVAIGLNSITLFLQPEQTRQLSQDLYDWAPAGSKIFVALQTREAGKTTANYKKLLEMIAAAGMPLQLYSLEKNIAMTKPWTIEHKELLGDFLSLPEDFVTEEEQVDIGWTLYAVFLKK